MFVIKLIIKCLNNIEDVHIGKYHVLYLNIMFYI